MEDQLVSFETAKLAKEKGFNEGTLFSYEKYPSLPSHLTKMIIRSTESAPRMCNNSKFFDKDNDGELLIRCSAPTQSLLQKWLRDTKDMWVTVLFDGITYRVSIWGRYTPTDDEIIISPFGDPDNWLTSYEQALEEGLKQALIIINN